MAHSLSETIGDYTKPDDVEQLDLLLAKGSTNHWTDIVPLVQAFFYVGFCRHVREGWVAEQIADGCRMYETMELCEMLRRRTIASNLCERLEFCGWNSLVSHKRGEVPAE